MGIAQISNSSLLSQLEVMNKQMTVMGQSATAFTQNMTQSQNPANFGHLAAQSSYFNGESAALALRDQSAGAIANPFNPTGAVETRTELQPTTSAGQSVGEFKQLLKDAFENVNVLQNEASSLQSRFDLGDRSITLADVMIASNKSSLSFEATLQIRNKLVDAYQSIMQMQI